MKLEVGKKYELNNGKVITIDEMVYDDPLHISNCGYAYGPFYSHGIGLFHQDGRFAGGDCPDLDVKQCLDDPRITSGNTYTAINGIEWECIFVRDGKAWMTHGDGPAYIWNAETGVNISHGGGEYNIAFPDRRNGSVEYVNGEPQFDTWQEDE